MLNDAGAASDLREAFRQHPDTIHGHLNTVEHLSVFGEPARGDLSARSWRASRNTQRGYRAGRPGVVVLYVGND